MKAASAASEPSSDQGAAPRSAPWDSPLSHLAFEMLQVTADFPGFNGEYLDRIGAKDFFAGITEADITQELIDLENATLIENAQGLEDTVPEWWITEAGTETLAEPRPPKLSKDERSVLRALAPPRRRGEQSFTGWHDDEISRRAGVQVTVARNILAVLCLHELVALGTPSGFWTRTERGTDVLEAAPPCSHPHDGGRLIARASEYAVRCGICGEVVTLWGAEPAAAPAISGELVRIDERDTEIATLRADLLRLAETIDDLDADTLHLDMDSALRRVDAAAVRVIVARTMKAAGKTPKCIATRAITQALPTTITVNSRFRCIDQTDQKVGEIVTVMSNGFSLLGVDGEPWGEHADTIADLIEANALRDETQWEILTSEDPATDNTAPEAP